MNNVVSTTKRFVENKENHYKVIQDSISSLNGYIHKNSCAPILTERFLEIIKNEVGNMDLYLEEKELFNKEMLSLESDFREIINKSGTPIDTALILSGAANIIDFGLVQNLDKKFVKEKIQGVLRNSSVKTKDYTLSEDLDNASSLLYIGDNCGEAVLDKLFLEKVKDKYPEIEIYYAVRSIPVLNDMTKKEAYEIGLDKYAKIIESGSTLPGTIIERCNSEFRQLYETADIKIIKGMGNVETASRYEKDAYFVFMIKCQFFSRKLKTQLYDVLIHKGNPLYER